ncbi:MAG: DNA translocase FtsK [Porphyromonadaceae bacterium]|nr:DNA translocase FtsK [Porphyromonadaceae bacterium]
MAKTSGKTSSNPRGRRPAAGSAKGNASSPLSDIAGGLRDLVTENFSNRRIPTLIGLVLLAFFGFACLSLITFLFSGGSDQSLILASGEGEATAELAREAKNIFGLPGARIADYLFNQLFGWGIVFALSYLAFLFAHLIWRPRIAPYRYVTNFLINGFLLLWTSVAAAGLQSLFPSDSFLRWGGLRGEELFTYIYRGIGIAGLLGVLAFTLLIFAVTCSSRVLSAIQNPKVPKVPHVSVPRPEMGGFFSRLFSRKKQNEEPQNEEDGYSQAEDAWRDEPPMPTDDEDMDVQEEDPTPYVVHTPTTTTTATTAQTAEAAPSATSFSRTTTSEPSDVPEMIVEEAPKDDLVEDGDRTAPEPLAPGIQLALYRKPTIDLLRDYEQGGTGIDMEEIEYNKQKIIDTLASFKMNVTPCKATVGPTVTLYEVIPESGIKVSRIKTMEDDIAMSLKSEGVRIIAPMPGLGTIGIEVPNSTPQTVSMRSILASRKYREQQEKMELPIGIGKTITNEPFIFDLTKMPHLLIAGATGQGKSVGLNALITSLLYSKRPEELKFVMVDPKMLEFSIYEEIERHFLAKLPDAERAIITDMTKVVATLNSLCIEMDNRYRLLQTAGRAVRNIREYNEQVRSGALKRIDGHEILPYIVLIVDEFADLMMTVGKEVEQPIARLAQKARAAGIHMVIATQRPSTDVITGLIKANFPARIAFKVFSMVDSRTVLDSPGANQLIGRGDMLFYQGKDMIRVQCAFMDTPETEAIVEYIAQQESTGSAYELPEYIPEGEENGAKGFNLNEKDSLFDEVARMVVQTQVGSTSNIQRKFNIGYNRAGRLMDQLEGAGIVGVQEGSKPREVYIKDQATLEQLLQKLS